MPTAEKDDDGTWMCLTCGFDVFNGCACDHGEWQCSHCGEWTYPFYYDREDGCSFCGKSFEEVNSSEGNG